MPLFGNKDLPNNMPNYVTKQFKKEQTANNKMSIYGNATSNAFVGGQTVGVFAADVDEVGTNPEIASQGWVLKTVGSGGRAGRVHYETLVATHITTQYANSSLVKYSITIDTQPTSRAKNVADYTTVSVVAHETPSASPSILTYQWMANTGSGFANLTANSTYANVTTANLYIANVQPALNNAQYKVKITAGANSVNSSVAVLTVN
jgi:hypothetical protein